MLRRADFKIQTRTGMLSTPKIIKQYNLGIIAPSTFNDSELIRGLISDKIFHISKIITNNVETGGKIIAAIAEEYKIPYLIFPIPPSRGGALITNAKIIANSDFVYLIDDGKSHNFKNAKEECERKSVKFRTISL